MPDPNARRDRALEQMAKATEAQTKVLAELNKNLIAIGRAIVPAAQAVNGLLAMFNEGLEDAESKEETDAPA